MADLLVYDRGLTQADYIVLKNLQGDIEGRTSSRVVDAAEESDHGSETSSSDASLDSRQSHGTGIATPSSSSSTDSLCPDHKSVLRASKSKTGSSKIGSSPPTTQASGDIGKLRAMNDRTHPEFQPTVVFTVDDYAAYLPASIHARILQPYVRWAKTVVRHDTDVVMLTHIIMYFTTLVPSGFFLYRHFTYAHAVLHVMMEFYYLGTYTLMMHQHIHQRGILNRKYALFDRLFPYLLDPMIGHTWNSYYYHHVKHHHVEGNGPDDLSSTLRYQRDSVRDFLQYFGRFFFLVWLDLPLYFLRKSRVSMAAQTAVSEYSTYIFYFVMAKYVNTRATVFVYLIPLLILRIGLMIGNWGQHAFVDPDEPNSDYKSSITLIDVASNRFCFNDGYHTSHHLNPLRHWRDHPVSFLEQKHTYARENALVFHNIDFLMVTVRLLCKDYEHLAKCLVPIGSQIDLTMEGRIELLKRSTRRLTEEEIRKCFKQG